MFAGQLRDRIRVQARTKTRGPLGPTETWTDRETRWARVIQLTFSEVAQYQQTYPKATHKVVFRGSVDLSLGDTRLWWQGAVLVPIGVEYDPEGSPVGPRSFTVVLAQTRPEEADN